MVVYVRFGRCSIEGYSLKSVAAGAGRAAIFPAHSKPYEARIPTFSLPIPNPRIRFDLMMQAALSSLLTRLHGCERLNQFSEDLNPMNSGEAV